jgi:hypothetical protein
MLGTIGVHIGSRYWMIGSSTMCEGHTRCQIPPIFKVIIHRIDDCNKPPAPDSIYELCSACTRSAAYRIGEAIGAAYEAMPERLAGQAIYCRPCKRVINDLHDVISVEWLKVSA